MRLLYTLFFIHFIVTACNAQIYQSDTLTTLAYWEQGDIYKYEVEKYKLKETNGVKTETISKSYISLEVVVQTDSSYILNYSIDSIVGKSIGENNPILSSLKSEIYNRLIYEIMTDENGIYLGIKNWKELKNRISSLWDELDFVKEMSPLERFKARKSFDIMTDSKEKVENMFSREFHSLFGNYGYVFDTKDTFEYEQVLPNPYGGTPFPQYGKIYFEKDKLKSNNTIRLLEKSWIDEEEGKKGIAQVLKKIKPDLENFEEEFDKLAFQVSDRKIQEFDIQNGVIKFALTERTVLSDDLENRNLRIDRKTFRLIK